MVSTPKALPAPILGHALHKPDQSYSAPDGVQISVGLLGEGEFSVVTKINNALITAGYTKEATAVGGALLTPYLQNTLSMRGISKCQPDSFVRRLWCGCLVGLMPPSPHVSCRHPYGRRSAEKETLTH